ncbi:hypothetical protein [Bradyrhizobium sp. LMTR 3]|uniref:hypothetical protein n=1 Tax=Bradyrhizobium sp. LMTR 3 TaxID=189873 RepID=UPI000810B46E|nr:hypothetical protein [Bradyrhizobium sp. LMTR 3]OCK61260.1 hypothetical protein LMTR3_23900 [Bradyrhizobium sp. LMTR 3]
MSSTNDEPQLELPLSLPLPAQQSTRLAPVLLLLLALVGGGVYAAVDTDTQTTAKIPSRPEELSGNVVTLVSSDDRAAVASAVAAMRVAPAQRAEIAQAVIERRQRLGWIVFTDSMDPDGDTVAVEASGLTQQIVLAKSWTPVAVALADSGPIGVTALRDGQGGGITVAFATSSGTMPMRILRPGERIEVVP